MSFTWLTILPSFRPSNSFFLAQLLLLSSTRVLTHIVHRLTFPCVSIRGAHKSEPDMLYGKSLIMERGHVFEPDERTPLVLALCDSHKFMRQTAAWGKTSVHPQYGNGRDPLNVESSVQFMSKNEPGRQSAVCARSQAICYMEVLRRFLSLHHDLFWFTIFKASALSSVITGNQLPTPELRQSKVDEEPYDFADFNPVPEWSRENTRLLLLLLLSMSNMGDLSRLSLYLSQWFQIPLLGFRVLNHPQPPSHRLPLFRTGQKNSTVLPRHHIL